MKKMRLHNLSDNIIFDELTETSNINKKFFISSLLVIPTLSITKNFQSKLYTSQLIADNLRYYFSKHHKKLSKNNIVIMEPEVPLKVKLRNGETINVIAFEEDSCSKNLMFMVKRADRTTHVYAGVCAELRKFLFSCVFCEWIQSGVDNLYVDIGRAATVEERDSRELQSAVNTIGDLIKTKNEFKLVIKIPQLGYEKLIYALSERLRGQIFVNAVMLPIFTRARKAEYLAREYADAKISIVHKSFTLEEMDATYKENKCIFIQIMDKATYNKRESFYEICWSPLPSPFELYLLATICHPNLIHPITYNATEDCLIPQVPDYLLKLCSEYEHISKENEKVRNTEMDLFQDFSSPSSKKSCSSAGNFHVVMTQEVDSCANRQAYVSEWLSNSQGKHKRLRSERVANPSAPKESKFSLTKKRIQYIEGNDDSLMN